MLWAIHPRTVLEALDSTKKLGRMPQKIEKKVKTLKRLEQPPNGATAPEGGLCSFVIF